MTAQPDKLVVSQEAQAFGNEADDGAIAIARALADRDCGALQSEMRQARKQYLVQAFQRAMNQSAQAAERRAIERAAGVLAERSAELRTKEGQRRAQWHEHDAEMVAGELDRQVPAIRSLLPGVNEGE